MQYNGYVQRSIISILPEYRLQYTNKCFQHLKRVCYFYTSSITINFNLRQFKEGGTDKYCLCWYAVEKLLTFSSVKQDLALALIKKNVFAKFRQNICYIICPGDKIASSNGMLPE